MYTTEKSQHDLLLIITTALFVLFTTGLAVPPQIQAQTTVITS